MGKPVLKSIFYSWNSEGQSRHLSSLPCWLLLLAQGEFLICCSHCHKVCCGPAPWLSCFSSPYSSVTFLAIHTIHCLLCTHTHQPFPSFQAYLSAIPCPFDSRYLHTTPFFFPSFQNRVRQKMRAVGSGSYDIIYSSSSLELFDGIAVGCYTVCSPSSKYI